MKTIKLTKEFHKKFTDALRSGDYIQATSQLFNEDYEGNKYCCLGVAFDLVTEDNKCDWQNKDLPSDIDDGCLDEINYPDGLVENEDILAHLNDGNSSQSSLELKSHRYNVPCDEHGYFKSIYSFSDIADFIDDNLEIIEN